MLPGSREPYVLVEKSEAPGDYVDFTSLQVVAKGSTESGIGKKTLSPMKNWMGEDTELTRHAAYVFVMVDE